MMKLVSMLLTLCMVFCMLTVPAAADASCEAGRGYDRDL